MAGKAKYAEKLSKHLNSPVEAACVVSRPGSTTATAVTAGIGGAVGAAAATAASRRADTGADIAVDGNVALALGPDGFSLVKLDIWLGRPKGEAYAHVPYADVDRMDLKEGKITVRADLALNDGRNVAFEAKRLAANRPNVEVLELLASRCNG